MSEAKEALAKWWEFRQERQREINESIVRTSEPEILYHQPYEDRKRVRVTGPFTVEYSGPQETGQQKWGTIGSMAKRKTYMAGFKAKVVLELLREEKPLAQVAAEYEVHPSQLRNQLRKFFWASSAGRSSPRLVGAGCPGVPGGNNRDAALIPGGSVGPITQGTE